MKTDDGSVAVLKPSVAGVVVSTIAGVVVLAVGLMAIPNMLWSSIRSHSVVGIIASVWFAFPFIIIPGLVAAFGETVEVRADGIATVTRLFYLWNRRESILPWNKVHRIYIDHRKSPLGIGPSAVLVDDKGGLYEKRLKFWEWHGDWEKAVEIIEASLPAEAIGPAEMPDAG